MKVLFLDGSLEETPEIVQLRDFIIETFISLNRKIEYVLLRDLNLKYCTGCFNCWLQDPGLCHIKDEGNLLAYKIINAKLMILFTPITFGSYSSEIKKVLDRIISLYLPFFTKIEGEVHSQKRYVNYPDLLSIGYTFRNDLEEQQVFNELSARTAFNMHFPNDLAIIYQSTEDPTVLLKTLEQIILHGLS